MVSQTQRLSSGNATLCLTDKSEEKPRFPDLLPKERFASVPNQDRVTRRSSRSCEKQPRQPRKNPRANQKELLARGIEQERLHKRGPAQTRGKTSFPGQRVPMQTISPGNSAARKFEQ